MSVVKTVLSAHELELLKKAIPFAQEVYDSTEKYPTQAELMQFLHCRDICARHIQHFMLETSAVKVAARLDKLPVNAENKAIVQYATGQDLAGTMTSHVLRENVKLKKRLATTKFEEEARSAAREIKVREEIESLKEQAKAAAHTPVKITRPATLTGNMLEVNIPDAHFGKMAWGVETGYENYDVKIAQATYMRAVANLIERTSHIKYDEIVYVVGNDLLNSNDSENKTAHGTIVTTDGRYHKTFWKVRATVVETIEQLRKLAPVKVVMVYGNHDTLSSWHLGDSLESYFHKYDDVTIENNPTYRKYVEFGQNMIMLTHGDKAKREDYPMIMATEQPQMWSRTKFREAHCGHTHETKVQEKHGVRVRVLPALCPPDDWHAENGYVGNHRSAEAYTWNKTEGLISVSVYNDDMFDVIRTKRSIV